MTQHRTTEKWRPFSSSTLLYATAGAISAFLGWALIEPYFQEGGSSGRVGFANAFLFPVVAGMVSGSLAAVNKSVSRRFSQAAASAAGAFGVVFAASFLMLVPCQVLFNWFSLTSHPFAALHQASGFVATLAGRTLAWSLMGTIIGLGTSLMIGKPGVLLNGILGGILGGLMAGMLFDPLQVFFLGADKWPWVSRMVGFVVLGCMTGFLIGLMEDAASGGLLLVTSGPRAGTRVVLDARPCPITSSKAAGDILFQADPGPGKSAAVIQKIGLGFEVRALGEEGAIQVNRRTLYRTGLTHGDCIRIGGIDLLFSDSRRHKT